MTVLNQLMRQIVEGAEDSHHRQLARDAFKRISSELEHSSNVKWTRKPGPHSALSVNVGELLKTPDYRMLTLTFANTPAKANARLRTKGTELADIFLDIKVQDKTGKLHGDIPIDRWELSVKKLASKMLQRKKDEFVHEFIHFLDWRRMGKNAPRAIAGVDSSSPASYYNSHLEQNAYIQQGLSAIEDYLDGKDAKEVKDLIGPSANEFMKRVLNVLPEEFVAHMNGDTRKRLAKRVTQAYNDITNKEMKR